MRKIIIAALLAATALPGMAMAQNRELSRDRHDIRQEQRELRQARRYGDGRDVRREARDVRQSRREYREDRSEEHTSELQSLMSISYAVFSLKKKKKEANRRARTHQITTTQDLKIN